MKMAVLSVKCQLTQLSTDSLVLSVCLKRNDNDLFHYKIMNNRNINTADMSQLYFMLGIAKFVRLCYVTYRFSVNVCDWNEKT